VLRREARRGDGGRVGEEGRCYCCCCCYCCRYGCCYCYRSHCGCGPPGGFEPPPRRVPSNGGRVGDGSEMRDRCETSGKGVAADADDAGAAGAAVAAAAAGGAGCRPATSADSPAAASAPVECN